MRKYYRLFWIIGLLVLAGCGTSINIDPDTAEPSIWDNPAVEFIVKILLGLLLFAYALVLIWLSIKFHLFLMEKYKRFFFRDELKQSIDKLKARGTLTKDDILRHAAIVLGAGVYQGLVFLAILHLIASMQTPFG